MMDKLKSEIIGSPRLRECNGNNLTLAVHPDDHHGAYRLYVETIPYQHKAYSAVDFHFESSGIYEVSPQSHLLFNHGEMQQLMDSLWRAGFRPTKHEPASDRIAAMQAHLNDMRAIVSKKLNVQL